MNKTYGTFKHCTNCNSKVNCCSSFDHIDNPLITKKELNKIIKTNKIKDFYIKETNNLYSIKTINSSCIFYHENSCSIYNNRPVDCKLYPFDIVKEKNSYYLVIYSNPCINITNEILKEFIKDNILEIKKLIKNLTPYLEEYTSNEVNKKLNNKSYIIIEKIKSA